jgi:ferredoxin-NADP reductase/Na+-translocating ferredoxin:NAD+ oxidoreductase RnfD subunit
MIDFIDNFLNNITMYRLVLYYLIFLILVAFLLSFVGFLPFSGFMLGISVCFFVIIGFITNTIFAKVFQAYTNVESVYISSLILALIISPLRSIDDLGFFFWATVWTMASKYIFAYKKKHIFNPVAFAVFLTAISIGKSATWWVGTAWMMPFVVIGGLLVVRKIRKANLVVSFFLIASLTILCFSLFRNADPLITIKKAFLDSPLLFFAFVMITEPLTTPPTEKLQVLYAGIVGFLFTPQLHIGSVYSTPEVSLLLGNIFSYIVSPKNKLILVLKEKVLVGENIYDFIFNKEKNFSYIPGQYLEWTLGHKHPDARGNRRYFTLASSPTEDEVRIGVKFYNTPSSFKKALMLFEKENSITASQLSGDFVLPKDEQKKIVFIAGGIGITPFRSMIKYLLDIHQKRPIILLYTNKTAREIAYADIFEEAKNTLGIKTVYTITDMENIPKGWTGRVGYFDEQVIKEEIPDYSERIFYISGPHTMITTFEKILKQMGVKKDKIKIDFFPGFT